MKIVEIDGYAAARDDIDWQPWKEIEAPDGTMCEFVYYDRTPAEQVAERLADADMVITNKVLINEELMAQLPKLRYIGVLATGYNVVDVEAAHRRGITVTNIPAYSTDSVAQLAIAHLLNIASRVAAHDDAVHKGEWERCPDFSFTVSPLRELAGQTFAVVGLGNTGMATARIANALGMKVVAFTSKDKDSLPDFISKVQTMEELFANADVLSLHCPLTAATHHLVNAERLALMKKDAIIINTGRGPLIDEQALADALNEGRISAAGVDVLEEEPPVHGSPLLTARNCHVTPHIAWASLAARKRLMKVAISNVKAFLEGNPQNVV